MEGYVVKRIWYILLLAMLLVIAACGGGDNAAPADSEANSNSNAEETNDGANEEENEGTDGEEIDLVYFQPGLDQPNQMEPVEEAVQRFEEANPGINVEIQTAGWDQTYQKLVTAFQSGNDLDFFYGRSEEHTSELQSRGHLV